MLNIDSLTRAYGTHRVIEDISLTVADGELVTIVGPSGCGKSTLLRCAAGLLAPSSGQVTLNGSAVTGVPDGLAVVFQDYSRSLYPWMSVRDNVALPLLAPNGKKRHSIGGEQRPLPGGRPPVPPEGLAPNGRKRHSIGGEQRPLPGGRPPVPPEGLAPNGNTRRSQLTRPREVKMKKRERQQRAMAALGVVGLTDAAAKYPWQLSGGMQQRVAIARALACDPVLLLMDEPFGSVDAQTREDLQDLILRVRAERGMTILLVTHDIDESVYVGDRVIVLSRGPGRVRAEVAVDLPAPRDQIATKELPEFAHLRAEVSRLVRGGTREGDQVRR